MKYVALMNSKSKDFIENLLSYSDKINRLDIKDNSSIVNRFLSDDLSNPSIDHIYSIENNKINIAYNIPFVRIGHQIAHMVEINDLKKCLLPNWGFKTFQSFTPSKEHIFRAIARETRVRAIEKIIYSDYLAPIDLFNDINFYWKDLVKNILPYGKFNSLEEVKDWCQSIEYSTLNIWSLDKIEYDWKIRIDYISNHLESKNEII